MPITAHAAEGERKVQQQKTALDKIRRIVSKWLAHEGYEASAALQAIAAVLLEPIAASEPVRIRLEVNADPELIDRLHRTEAGERAADQKVERLLRQLGELAAENHQLRQRLEIDPRHPYDGIAARDETIKGLEEELKRWKLSDEKAGEHILHLQAEMADLRSELELLQIILQDTHTTAAARDVLVERRRQIEAEGWTPERDDEYSDETMAAAAGCYALHAYDHQQIDGAPAWWPWDDVFWKPTSPRRNLIKAGALIVAEIERLDRAGAKAPAAEAGVSLDQVLEAEAPAELATAMSSQQLAEDEQACRQAYDNTYHKIRPDMLYGEWQELWARGETPHQLHGSSVEGRDATQD